jgi:hypothetical protein
MRRSVLLFRFFYHSEQKMRSVFVLRVIFNTPPSQVFSPRMPGEKVQHFMLPSTKHRAAAAVAVLVVARTARARGASPARLRG